LGSLDLDEGTIDDRPRRFPRDHGTGPVAVDGHGRVDGRLPEKTLPSTIASIRAQHYPNIEHIIIDGGSTDGTIDIVRSNEDAIAYWRSEPDAGIYDAFNKGIALSRGDFVGILNADDYYEPDQISNAVKVLADTGAPFVHGNITLHGWQGSDVELHGDPFYEAVVRHRMPSLHQVTTLCRRSVFEQHGLFSTRYRIAGDYDWYLRLAKRGCIGYHSPKIHAHMRAGGISTTQQRRAFVEAFLITWRHGLPLWRAMRTTFPRIAYPNGTPPWLSHAAATARAPVATAKRLVASAKRRVKRLLGRPARDQSPLLETFAAARHVSLDIDPVGLEWLYGVGLRARSFASRCVSPGGTAAGMMLSGSACRETPNIGPADVVVIEDDGEAASFIDKYAARKTIIVIARADPAAVTAVPWPSLDFHGFRGFGVLLDPAAKLRD
jgi:GT2 family glycosyltransferase